MKSWFQLVEKFEHVQTFQLIENENEWIAFGMEENVAGKHKLDLIWKIISINHVTKMASKKLDF